MATYNAPQYRQDFRELPTYDAPSWDEAEVGALTQKRAAPGLRAMRQQINRFSGGSFDNPNVKRMTLRDALAGYGAGLSSIMGAAGASAAGEYGNKYGLMAQEAWNKYRGGSESAGAYNAYAEDVARMDFQGQSEEAKLRWQSDESAEARAYGTLEWNRNRAAILEDEKRNRAAILEDEKRNRAEALQDEWRNRAEALQDEWQNRRFQQTQARLEANRIASGGGRR